MQFFSKNSEFLDRNGQVLPIGVDAKVCLTDTFVGWPVQTVAQSCQKTNLNKTYTEAYVLNRGYMDPPGVRGEGLGGLRRSKK